MMIIHTCFEEFFQDALTITTIIMMVGTWSFERTDLPRIQKRQIIRGAQQLL